MQEPSTPEVNAAKPVTEAQSIAAERPQDDKNRIITRLKNISSAAQRALAEQKPGNEKHVFNQKVERVISLGEAYTRYLEDHIADADLSSEVFNRIAFIAKNSLLMNIESYVNAITARIPANKFITDYLAQHPDLAALDPGGNAGPWSGIKEPLYFSVHNDIRELYREAIINHARDLIASGEFSPRDVDHLERFLIDPKGRMPSEFIPEYLQQHAAEIQQWTPLSLSDFQKYVVTRIGNYQGEMSQNDFLRQLDEEIASIKPKDIKGKYSDREKKQAFIRNLRFGRVNLEQIKAEVRIRAAEINRIPTLDKELGPRLRQNWRGFREELRATAGQDPTLRKQALITLLSTYGLPPQDLEFVTEYLEKNIV